MAYFYHGNISPLELSVNGTSKFKGVDTSTPGILQVYDNNSTNYAQIQAPGILSSNYTLTLPTNDGDANQFLQTDGNGTLSWTSAATLSNGEDNRVVTSNNLNEIKGEANLLFDGTDLLIAASGQAQFRSSAIHIASNAASALTATSDGTINLVSADRTTFITAASNIASVDSTGIDLANGKSYQIDNTDVLTSTGLGSGIVVSSLTSVGTLNGLTVQSSTNSADIIKLHADSGASQTITVINDEGTNASAIGITASAGGITINASSNLELNSSGGLINVGNDAVSQNINIGTGAAARTIIIGNNNTSSGLSLTSGTGGHTVDSSGAISLNSSGGSISIGNNDVDQPINIGTQGERTISIGTGGFPDIINIGNNNTTTAVSITSGTGNTIINTPSMLVTHTSHSDLTVKSTNTTDGEAYLTLISDNAGDAGDGWRLKSVNGVLTISSDHNSSGTYGETILTMRGHDTDSSRITEITGNLDISAGVDVTGSITCSVDLDIEGDIDMATGKKITWVDDNQYISGTATGITIESDDTLLVNADTSMTFDTPDVIFTSSTTDKPLFEIVNSTNDATGSHLRLANKRGANNGDNGDVAGTIDFFTNDEAQNNQSFGEVKVVATTATSGSEQGTMTIGVACTDDGGVDTVLTITGGANAATSTTTIAGNLDISAGVDVTGSITCSVDLDIEGDIDMATGKKITWVDDNQYISGTGTGITIEAEDTLVINADTSMTFDTPDVIFTSSTTDKPVLEIKNTNTDATGPILLLNNANGTAAGSDSDVCGTISFNANDDQSTADNQSFARIIATAVDTASTSEKGKIEIGVACTDDGGIDTVLTITGGASSASSTTIIEGDVLIGATSFGKASKVWVEGGYSGGTETLTYTYLIPGLTWGNITFTRNWSIGCNYGMVSPEYDIYSDERLKKNFISLENTEAYDKINQIKIYKYKLKKELDYGREYLGVKAQEVELFYPECISKTIDVLPSIMEKVIYNNKKFTLTSIGDIVVGDKLKIYYQDKTRNNVETYLIARVVNVLGNEVEIDTEIKDDDDEIYIFGKEYDDVRTIDYNKLNLMSIGAIQKLIIDKTELETKVSTLESDVAILKEQVATLIANSS